MQPRRSRYGDATETVALRLCGTVDVPGAIGVVAFHFAGLYVAYLRMAWVLGVICSRYQFLSFGVVMVFVCVFPVCDFHCT